jgi:coiled-coil domain-containing protein 130
MQTDPKNTAYIVLSGATKRSVRDSDEGDLIPSSGSAGGPIITDAEREDQRQNAFSNLEKTIADRERLIQANERISSLMTASSKHWDDPYAQNQKLRRLFRVGRKQREKDAAATEDLQERMGLGGMELLPESEEDRARAALVDFGPLVVDEYEGEDGDGTAGGAGGRRALAKPLFSAKSSSQATRKASSPGKGILKAERVAAQRKDNFVTELMDNTRAVQDPFLIAKDTKGPSRLPGVKRKRDATDAESDAKSPLEPAVSRDRLEEPKATAATTTITAAGSSLVDYDSD